MKRLLAIMLASLMILSSATAGASAYQAYKDDALTNYDFTDTAVLTTEQYASALLDSVDEMLKKENIYEDLSILGTLDATSIDNALDSVYDLINGNSLILLLAGDLNDISVSSIKTNRRSNSTDVQVIKDLLSFLNDNKKPLKKVVVGGIGKQRTDGGFSLGVANSFINMELDISKMLREELWKMAYGKDVAYVAGDSRDNLDSILQNVIDTELGKVEEIPASVLALLDINSTKSVYDLIEEVLQVAYNDIAVDMLNTQLMPWVDAQIEKDDTLASLFNKGYQFKSVTVADGETFIDQLNNILGDAVNGMMKNYSGWVEGDNSKLTSNIMALGRFVLKETGDSFFPKWQKHIASADEIDAMTDDQVVAYVVRSIVNGSVSYMYIDESVTSTIGVVWEIVEQVMAQFIPERDYSSYPKTVQGILDMLADYLVYSVNPGMDLNAGSLRDGLAYGQGLDKTLTTIFQWVAAEPQYYTGLLPTTTIDTSDGWKAIDDVLFALLDKTILPAKYNTSSETIFKNLVYDLLNGLLVDTDLSCLTDLFVRNESGVLATNSVKQTVINLVTKILNAVLPGTITTTYTTLDSILSNEELGNIVVNLIGALNTYKDQLVPPVVNIVAQVMGGLVSKSKFGQMKFNEKSRATGDYTITVKNGSSGINKGFTAKDGTFTQDALYKYEIVSASAVAYDMNGNSVAAPSVGGLTAGTVIASGGSVDASVTGTTDDSLVILTVKYHVIVEDGSKLTSEPLVARTYTYVKSIADVDQESATYITDPGPTKGKKNVSSDVTHKPAPGLLLFDQDNKNPVESIAKTTAGMRNTSDDKYAASIDLEYSPGSLTEYLEPSDDYQTMDFYGEAAYTPTGVLFRKDSSLNPKGYSKNVSLKLWDVKDGVTTPASFEVGFTCDLKYNMVAGRKSSSTYYENSYKGTVKVIVFNNYKLPSLVNSAISANRDRDQYASGSDVDTLWANYESALLKAAILTKRPGMIAQYTDASYLAQFETAYNALEEAIYQLDGGEKLAEDGKTVIKDYGDGHRVSASVSTLKTAVEAVQGKDNAKDAVYWDADYNYFGYDDFGAVAWSGWKEARNRALNLYNSTIPPEEPEKPEEPGEDASLSEQSKYQSKLEQYEKDHAAWEKKMATWEAPVISSTDVAYAEQQVKLWGPRILGWKVDAVKTHLDSAISMCAIDSSNASQYDAERWADYAKSLAYAQAVSSSFSASKTMRTQVREAMNNLIYNWKRLTLAEVVPVTFTFTVNGKTHYTLNGNAGDTVDLSSVPTPSAPVGQHFVGWGSVPATFDKDTSFEAVFANNTDTKYTVNVYQMDTTGNYPSAPTSSYQGAGETGTTADITSTTTAPEGFSIDSKSTLTGTIAGDGSLVLSVYMKRNQYTITFANTNLEAATYYYGATVSIPTPEKDNFTFDKWEGEIPTTMPAKSITLTATWIEDPANYDDYNIAVENAKAAQGIADYDKIYTAESRQALAAALAVDVSGKKISEQKVVDDQTAAINAAVAGLKKQSHKATFIVNGKTVSEESYEVGATITAPSVDANAVPGYTFTGWDKTVGTMGFEDITFTAQFSAGNSNYTVETYTMGTDGQYGAAVTEVKAGTTDSTATVTPEAKTGFTVADSSVLSGTVAADGSLTLKVYYSRNKYDLTVDGVTTQVYYGATVSVSKPEGRDGFTWLGWNEDVPSTMPANSVTITSNWSENDADYEAYTTATERAAALMDEDYTKKYTEETRNALAAALDIDVTNKKYSQQSEVDAATKAINDAINALELMSYNVKFIADGITVSDVDYKVGATITVPGVPEKQGFVGKWDKSVTTMGLEDITVTAVYTPGNVSYTVETYVMDLNGNYILESSANEAAKTGDPVSVTPEARTGFTVDGSSVLSGTVAADNSTALKVYYSRNQYTLSVDGTETQVYYGAALDFGTPAGKEGFTFTGWDSDATTMPAENLTVKSTWSENDADYMVYDSVAADAAKIINDADFTKTYTEATRNALTAALAVNVAGKKYSEQKVVDDQAAAIQAAIDGLEKMTYNAIFMADGSVYETVPTKVGEQIVVPEDPRKDGWTFSEWDPTPGEMGLEDVTFTAVFIEGASSYKVETYVMGLDGEYTLDSSASKAGTTNSTATVTPEAKTGFTVADNSVLSGTVAADGSLTLKVYYSRNQYTLSVDGNETQVYYGAALDFGTPAGRTGFTFTGWDSDATTMPAENLTVKSTWSENDADYTAYNEAKDAAAKKQAEANYDKKYTEETRNALAAALAIDVSAKKYSQQSEVDAATKAINDAINALELMSYKATFVVNGATVSENYYKVDETIVAPEVDAEAVPGYTFTGWDKTVGKMGFEDITFTAQFSAGNAAYKVETYIMGLDGNYGTPTTDNKSGATNSTATVAPEAKTGFTVADNSVLSGTIAADGSLVLKVYYSRNQYTLSVDGNETQVYYGAALNFGTPADRTGFTFTGWDSDATTMPAENLTVKSTWSENDADYTAYNKAKDAAAKKQAEANYDKKYTEDTRNALAAALAIDVSGKKYSQQSEVDAATKAIDDAVAGMELMTYNAIFKVNGATYATVPTKVDAQIVAPKDPTVDGFNFTGWNPTVGKMGTEDVVFEAVLVANNSSIVSVKAEEPNYGGMHQYVVKVKGEPTKIQFIDANGATRTLDRNTSMTSDANAFGILKIEKTDDGELWTINVNLPEGTYAAKAKFGKVWETETRSFTVAYDEQPAGAPGDVLGFKYETPNYGGKQNYSVKVAGKADKIQLAANGGGTRTYSRTNSNVTIKSYDADGNEVYASSTNIAYEIWTVNVALEEGDYAIKAKYEGKWGNSYSATVTFDEKVVVTTVSVTGVAVNDGSVDVTVNGTANKIQITDANGATRTYNRDNANVSIVTTDAGEVWNVNVKLAAGEYTARAKYINDAGKQVWDSTNTAFTVA